MAVNPFNSDNFKESAISSNNLPSSSFYILAMPPSVITAISNKGLGTSHIFQRDLSLSISLYLIHSHWLSGDLTPLISNIWGLRIEALLRMVAHQPPFDLNINKPLGCSLSHCKGHPNLGALKTQSKKNQG